MWQVGVIGGRWHERVMEERRGSEEEQKVVEETHDEVGDAAQRKA